VKKYLNSKESKGTKENKEKEVWVFMDGDA